MHTEMTAAGVAAGSAVIPSGHAAQLAQPPVPSDIRGGMLLPIEAFHTPRPRQASHLDERLRAGLADPDPDRRIDAIRDIYDLEPHRATLLLQRLLLTERDGRVYQAATAALADFAGATAVAAVTTGLAGHHSAQRSAVIETLGVIGEPATHLLGQVLFADPEPALRLRAVELLAELAGDTPAAMALLQAATGDSDPQIRRAAEDVVAAWDGRVEPPATANHGLLSSAFPGKEEDADALFRDIAANSQPEARVEAIQRLYSLDEDAAVHTLRAVLERDEDLTVREEALITLQLIGSDGATAAIEAGLGDESPDMRRRALEAMWLAERGIALPLAGQVLYADPDPEVRLAAIRLLATDRHPTARVLLEVARSDPDEAVHTLATRLSAR